MIVLGLGSNISNEVYTREENIANAINLLGSHPDISIMKVSHLYETEPVGLKEQPNFLNAVIVINSALSPLELLGVCLATEQQMGRVREIRWGPRNIDIDLLIYHDVEMATPALELPHPRVPERKFVLIPLDEIAGSAPVYRGKTARELLNSTLDDSQVILYGEFKPFEQATAFG
jgi:2-amino-4-hydroxy-6-hydroxymethyldihydropteridine diphosphokinase